MGKRQLIALSICTFAVYSGIGGLVGLMPVYLARLGADPGITGLFLACAYLALALSNVVAGRFSERFRRRKLPLIVGGVAAVPIVWLMSRATGVGQLGLLMACLWFAIGVPMTMANILIGLSSEATHRGRNFGLLSLSSGLGLFAGGLVSGPIVDRRGFPALFAAFALVYLLIPAAGVFVRDQAAEIERATAAPNMGEVVGNRTFAALFVASILAQAANVIIFLSRSLIMDARHFDATAISRASAIGSLVTLPLPLVIGWLVDRLGRKMAIVACFLAPILGLLVQVGASEQWHFWISSILSMVLGFSTVAGSALLTDRFHAASVSTALSLLGATPWIGLVIGLSVGGLAIRALQMTPALLLAALVGLGALLLLLPVSERPSERMAEAY
jgi:MFS family permease